MSHTLHRCGTPRNLKDDFVILSMSAKTVNVKGSGPKMKKLFGILGKHEYVNFGEVKTGSRYNSEWEIVHEGFKDQSVVHYVFNDRKVLKNVLSEIKEAELGLSVIVSGVIDSINDLCQQVGLKMHTVEFSGGILGKTDLLPEKPVLQITTMCGHGLVATNLVKKMAKQVKRGMKTLEEAAIELAKPCMCGVFNTKRAEDLLKQFDK